MRFVLAALVVALAALPAGAQTPEEDMTDPEVTCAPASAGWHANNISVGCTATDAESGIPNPADQAFDLTTSVPDGEETADASTDSRDVCNGATPTPFCVTAGPVGGIKVDRKDPTDPTQVRSTDHKVGKWSRDRTIAMSFNAASDGGSGVDGFSRSWTRSAGTVPDTAKGLEQGARRATSSRRANGRWWFHLRTRDNVGNWTSTVHRGPYLIDFSRPRAKALSGSGKTRKSMRLRYRTGDNNGRTREKVTITRSGKVLRTWRRGMATARFTTVQSVGWTPRAAGRYALCVTAWDPAGNSRRNCASVSVANPAPPPRRCHPSYPTVCIPPPPPDLDCGDIPFRNFVVLPPDPHRFDGNHDGRGCES